MYMCMYIYLVRNSEMVYRNTSKLEYFIPIVNLERNSKPWL